MFQAGNVMCVIFVMEVGGNVCTNIIWSQAIKYLVWISNYLYYVWSLILTGGQAKTYIAGGVVEQNA